MGCSARAFELLEAGWLRRSYERLGESGAPSPELRCGSPVNLHSTFTNGMLAEGMAAWAGFLNLNLDLVLALDEALGGASPSPTCPVRGRGRPTLPPTVPCLAPSWLPCES